MQSPFYWYLKFEFRRQPSVPAGSAIRQVAGDASDWAAQSSDDGFDGFVYIKHQYAPKEAGACVSLCPVGLPCSLLMWSPEDRNRQSGGLRGAGSDLVRVLPPSELLSRVTGDASRREYACVRTRARARAHILISKFFSQEAKGCALSDKRKGTSWQPFLLPQKLKVSMPSSLCGDTLRQRSATERDIQTDSEREREKDRETHT